MAVPSSGLSPSPATTLEKVTTHPALDYFASPSQDGRFLAFVSDRSGNADIWVKSLAAGAVSLPRQLTTHPAVDRDPSLNADGTRLLYVSHKTDPRGDVYLLDLVTGKETQLTDIRSGDSTPQWDVDGQSFFYLKQDPKTGKQSVVSPSAQDPRGKGGRERNLRLFPLVKMDGWSIRKMAP